jgi:FtsH-binding integral membrane protein
MGNSLSRDDGYYAEDMFVADAQRSVRAAFIRNTYAHLGAAVLGFMAITTAVMSTPALHSAILGMFVAAGSPIIILLAFMGVSMGAQWMAHQQSSQAMQYTGLILYTVLEAIIFVPLLTYASVAIGSEGIMQAGLATMIIFGGLTAYVMITGADFSFLYGFLWIAVLGMLACALGSAFFGFQLGLVYVSIGIVVFSLMILYDTSNVLHHYHTDQHVAAALELFASLATLFWYVLRLATILNADD